MTASEKLKALQGWKWIELDLRAEIIAVIEAAEEVLAQKHPKDPIQGPDYYGVHLWAAEQVEPALAALEEKLGGKREV